MLLVFGDSRASSFKQIIVFAHLFLHSSLFFQFTRPIFLCTGGDLKQCCFKGCSDSWELFSFRGAAVFRQKMMKSGVYQYGLDIAPDYMCILTVAAVENALSSFC